MKMVVAVLLVAVCLMGSPEIEMGVEAGPADCLDACQTACVQPSQPRLTARCERKCTIRCGPD
uniref:Thionin n=1 Tax=Kalanchoe fedtschenkoi TaxID=63787 RepID=A0A7N0U5J1_KALFE